MFLKYFTWNTLILLHLLLSCNKCTFFKCITELRFFSISVTRLFLFLFFFPPSLNRLRRPDFPRRLQNWQVWVQPETWHTAAHDVHRRLPACHAGGDGSTGWDAKHEDVQHQRHELHPRGTGPGTPEADAWAGGHIWGRPCPTGNW